MKHVLRRRTLRGLGRLAEGDCPPRAVVRHVGSDQKYELPVRWDAAGVAESVWTIPKGAKLGRYEIVMEKPGGAPSGGGSPGPRRGSGPDWVSGHFRVEEFRVPLMRAAIKPPAEPLVAATEFPVDLSVQYLAGGGASRLPVRLRAQVQRKSLPDLPALEGFTRPGQGGGRPPRRVLGRR
jgi:uncharacterized protein YfaS (alpha-2-macroglobulin family)